MENQNLEQKTEAGILGAGTPKGFVNCHFCDKLIELGKEYRSPLTNAPYCDPHCLVMYTED